MLERTGPGAAVPEILESPGARMGGHSVEGRAGLPDALLAPASLRQCIAPGNCGVESSIKSGKGPVWGAAGGSRKGDHSSRRLNVARASLRPLKLEALRCGER